MDTDEPISSDNESGTPTQTDIDSHLLTAMQSELLVLQQENRLMKEKLEDNKLDEKFFKNDDTNLKYYTGILVYQTSLC